MEHILSDDQIRRRLREICQAIADRAAAEQRVNAEHARCADEINAALGASLASMETRFHGEIAAVERDYQAALAEAAGPFDDQYHAVETEYHIVRGDVERQYEVDSRVTEREKADALWMLMSVCDDQSQDSPRFQFQQLKKRLSLKRDRLRDARRDLEELAAAADNTLQSWWLRPQFGESDVQPPPSWLAEAEERFNHAGEAIRLEQASLHKQILPRLFTGGRPYLLPLLAWIFLSGVLLACVDPAWVGIRSLWDAPTWQLAAAGISAAATLAGMLALLAVARSQSGAAWRNVEQAVAELRLCHRVWLDQAQNELQERQQEYERRYLAITAGRNRSLAKINDRAARHLEDGALRKQQSLADADAFYPELLEKITERRNGRLAALEGIFRQKRAALTIAREHELHAAQLEAARLQAECEANGARDRDEISFAWNSALSRFRQYVLEANCLAARTRVDWSAMRVDGWKLPESLPGAIQVGRYEFDFQRQAAALPDDRSFLPDPSRVDLPLTLQFPSQGSLLFKGHDQGRDAAVNALRGTMLRLLTSLPPGRIRFTVIDPVGLGEDFSAFMHLADFEEKMIGARIWTEKSHIEKRLADLSEHMEKVFQNYLRNDFETIEEYNEQAGEVAEPYHFLVVANFPVNFTEAAARRLVSIAASGARCGIYSLISVDTKQPLLHGFDVADLEANGTTLEWNGGSFHSPQPELRALPVTPDSPPRPADFVEIVRAVGWQSKHTYRVEVPFERIAPPREQLWMLSSRCGLDVPLGRVGSNRLQHLRLGTGTSQHVLVAGKTGSGKSSLLHTLITNVALNYSPDEVEFFLVDFKKGVEFKAYATNALPHARIIGIESDREFGISVLERLDGILRERGELFRRHGVQNIDGFRRLEPSALLPRILLVIDEFQEFFVEDDALSQSASLLLDRLVRQGRAFGVHVLLGSQTLGGAYALARSTLGQVAVRIALQCSEADAHLILSEDNAAARLLSRPGEAIYNDANGLIEGNHPFQVAWLPDDRRDDCLRQIRELAHSRNVREEPAIVFEGHVPSDASRNHFLMHAINTFSADNAEGISRRPAVPCLWLGEAVSIKPAPGVSLDRRAGENLLIVGSDKDSAVGTLVVSFLTIAAQLPAAVAEEVHPPRFYVLDGDAVRTGDVTLWTSLVELVPQRVMRCGQDDAAAAVEEIAAEVNRRTARGGNDLPPLFVFVSNLGRFRSLRNDEDDFGFSSRDSEARPNPGKLLASVLRDGPAVGVHVIVWCDTYGNLSRWMNFPMMRDFDVRLVFQMNAADSSNLIDNPAACKLGSHRALLYLRETGRLEKLRPYSVPSAQWLEEVAAKFKQRDAAGGINVQTAASP